MSKLELLSALPLLLFVWLLCVEASVHEYAGVRFVGKGNAFVVHGGSEGIYSSHPTHNTTAAVANGDAFIRFEKIKFRRPKEFSNFSSGLIQAVVFEVDDRETIGGSAYGVKGLFVAQQILQNWVEDKLVARLQLKSMEITKTGMYNLYFIHCDPKLKEVVLEGKTIWKNPTGYLPGRMAPLMNFYGIMSLAFVILGIFWFSQNARFWREVLPLQNCVTLVITLGMFEMAFWYFDYAQFNKTGVRPTATTIWAVTFGTVKRTVARLIILMVSMGYGVVRPTLGGLTSKVVMLGVTFFMASEVLELVENVGAVTTLTKLQVKRMMAKLDIYRKFTNALAVAVIVSVGWICYELYFKSSDVYNEQWQNAWIIPAFWQVLSFSLLCVICALWAPSQNSTRYAYSDDGSEEFDKDDTLTLIKPSPMPMKDVRGGPEARSLHGGNGLPSEDVEEEKTE
ncbi:Transmembrane protein 87A [Vitis vinifera]|uniref:Transmembrane protein 87A n=1 Tax=Vitis vinifera TaxID=29760 RepID=A0A438EWN3_VITVI|nr:Transmembrane protein 87A [Vitis vinifera]